MIVHCFSSFTSFKLKWYWDRVVINETNYQYNKLSEGYNHRKIEMNMMRVVASITYFTLLENFNDREYW